LANSDTWLILAEDEWIFSEQFNYIHGRALLSCFNNPKYVFEQAYKSLAPGGYFELQDIVFPLNYLGKPREDSAYIKWIKIIEEGTVKLGRPWSRVPQYKSWMGEVGFEGVVEKKFFWPLNRWAKGEYYKNISKWAQADYVGALEGLSLKVMGSLGYEPDKIREFVAEVTNDVKDINTHAYVTM
jgi:hypothetical protein